MYLKNYDNRCEDNLCYSMTTDGITWDHLHFHQNFEILIIYKAKKYSVRNNNTRLDFEKPAIFIHAPYSLHIAEAPTGQEYYRSVLHFKRQAAFWLFNDTIDFSPLQDVSFMCLYPTDDELSGINELALSAEDTDDKNKKRLYTALILNSVLRIHEDGRSRSVTESISYIQEALRIVGEDLSSQYTIERIASEMNVSVSKFQIDFKRHTGSTYKKYLTDLRMTRAIELLSCGSSIIHASLETGYSSEAHFIKVFREYYGVTPGEMKR